MEIRPAAQDLLDRTGGFSPDALALTPVGGRVSWRQGFGRAQSTYLDRFKTAANFQAEHDPGDSSAWWQ